MDDIVDIINKLGLPKWCLILKAEMDPQTGVFSLLCMPSPEPDELLHPDVLDNGVALQDVKPEILPGHERVAQPTPLPQKRGRPSKKREAPSVSDQELLRELLGDDYEAT